MGDRLWIVLLLSNYTTDPPMNLEHCVDVHRHSNMMDEDLHPGTFRFQHRMRGTILVGHLHEDTIKAHHLVEEWITIHGECLEMGMEVKFRTITTN
jgi:hypothetical protein